VDEVGAAYVADNVVTVVGAVAIVIATYEVVEGAAIVVLVVSEATWLLWSSPPKHPQRRANPIIATRRRMNNMCSCGAINEVC
jgi:hypothetical protein